MSVLIGIVSFVVFALVFAGAALPVIAVVEDDNAVVTWGVLAVCAFISWAAARSTHRWLTRRTS